MELQVLQEELARALSLASHFASSRAQLPILTNTALIAQKTKLTLLATNLETSIAISIGAKVEKEGSIAIPAKSAADLISGLNPGQISLEAEAEQLKIGTSSFKGRLSGINTSDFPSVPQEEVKGSPIKVESLSQALNKVLFSSSLDETRPVLTGVFFAFKKGELILVSSDGFRLSQLTLPIPEVKEEGSVIIPRNFLTEFSRIFDKGENIFMAIRKADNQIIFSQSGIVAASRTIAGDFPPFEDKIPKSFQTKVRIDKEDLKKGIKVASVYARESANILELIIKSGGITLSSESAKTGEQKLGLDAKVEGDAVNIKFNYHFLEEFINAVTGSEVEMSFNDSFAPAVFSDPAERGYLHLLMPIRIQG